MPFTPDHSAEASQTNQKQMAEPFEEEPGRNLLADLPGPAFQALWSFLPAASDRLNLFAVSRVLRDRIVGSCAQSVAFHVPDRDVRVPPSTLALLQLGLRRSQPLEKLTLGDVADGSEGPHEWLLQLLQEVSAAHAAAGPAGAAAGLRELELSVSRAWRWYLVSFKKHGWA